MIIKNARFLQSNQWVSKCPAPNKPEFAFIGRSNVGKSSLINMLCQSKNLARTSSTPGKTQLINHFIINEEWYLVDLPGYGYAKLSKVKREVLGKMITEYVMNRTNLICLFVLIDIRHEPQFIDLEFINKMGESNIPFAIVFTKADKIGMAKSEIQVEKYKQELLKNWEELPRIFITSAAKKIGKPEILTFINDAMENWDPDIAVGK